MPATKRFKRAVNVSISALLLQNARKARINLSATLEAALQRELRLILRREWLEQNRGAVQAYNRDVEEHSTFGDDDRAF